MKLFVIATWFTAILVFGAPFQCDAQTIRLPPRPASAPSGSEFVKSIKSFSVEDREKVIYSQIMSGNVPGWLRKLALVTTEEMCNGTNFAVRYYVAPDYFAVGSETDYFLTPMTPVLGQRLAVALNCSLPTRKMVNDIWRKAPCKIEPSPIPPSSAMTTVPVMATHNSTVLKQRLALTNQFPLGTLTAGGKKDVVISNRVYTNFARPSVQRPVVIYGWHQRNGQNIQPLYNGHGEKYADYSHGIRLVQMSLTLNGSSNTVTNVLMHPTLSGLLSDEGLLQQPFYSSEQAGK